MVDLLRSGHHVHGHRVVSVLLLMGLCWGLRGHHAVRRGRRGELAGRVHVNLCVWSLRLLLLLLLLLGSC